MPQNPLEALTEAVDALNTRLTDFMTKSEGQRVELQTKYDQAETARKDLAAKLDAVQLTLKNGTAGAPAPGGQEPPAPKTFATLVADKAKELGSKTKAIEFCAINFPNEHREFIASGKTL